MHVNDWAYKFTVSPEVFTVNIPKKSTPKHLSVVQVFQAKRSHGWKGDTRSLVDLESQYDFLEVEAAKDFNVIEKKPIKPDALVNYVQALLKL